MKGYKAIATFGGLGLIKKGAGTVAAFVACIGIWLSIHFDVYSANRLLFFTILTLAAGVFVSDRVEADWGKDSNKIVIDEVLGMFITMLFLPVTLKTLLAGFILFRFFDIAKPLYIRKAEALPGGWGVMLDDVAAGFYSNIVLRLLLLTPLLS